MRSSISRSPHTRSTRGRPNEVITRGPAIHHRTVQRLACDGRIEVALYKNDGDAVGVGRAAREPPGWLRRQVLRRDSHTCTFPGCDMKRFLHTHHMQWWEFERRSNLVDLIAVCTWHHKLVHEHGWSVELDGGSPVWLRPGGQRFDPGPKPAESAPPQPEPAESSDDFPWPALWHALHNGDSALSRDPAWARFLKLGARWIDFGRLGHGDLHSCRQEMMERVSCSLTTLLLFDGAYQRRRHRPRPARDADGRPRTCGDCGTPPGGLHHPGCDLEMCPRCRRQLISCGCWEDLESSFEAATSK
jgi:hypothetical protein